MYATDENIYVIAKYIEALTRQNKEIISLLKDIKADVKPTTLTTKEK